MEDIGRVNALPLLCSFGIRELRMRRLREMVRSVVARSGQPILALAGTPSAGAVLFAPSRQPKIVPFPRHPQEKFWELVLSDTG
jgi:hypothetical protein